MKNKILSLGCGLALSAIGAQAADINKPNIIMILVDDLGYGDLSCQEGSTDVQTPHIDRLLNQGIRCTNFYANCPVSSPSRASLLTGRYPDMVGVPGVIRTDEFENWGYLSQEAVLLPQMLKQNGYETSIIGKWHLGLESPNTPTERGFDYFHGFLGDMMEDYYTHIRCKHNYMRENMTEVTPEGHATEIFTRWAIDYISAMRKKQHPYFMYLAYNAPHTPVQPPTEWLKKVKQRNPNLSEKRAKLVALIEHLDHNIGKLYQYLEKNGELENTLIIFASDNGGQSDSCPNNGPFRGAKEEMFDGGIHVAGGFYWKNHIQPAVVDNFVMLMDIFPTLCDLTHVTINHEIDGMSVLPLLQGKPCDTDDRITYWVRREGYLKYRGLPYYAAKYKNFKIMQNFAWEPFRFFDLKNDPAEQHPIEKQHEEMYKKLMEGLTKHVKQTGRVPWQGGNK